VTSMETRRCDDVVAVAVEVEVGVGSGAGVGVDVVVVADIKSKRNKLTIQPLYNTVVVLKVKENLISTELFFIALVADITGIPVSC